MKLVWTGSLMINMDNVIMVRQGTRLGEEGVWIDFAGTTISEDEESAFIKNPDGDNLLEWCFANCERLDE